jgi:hypothetical protein
LGKIAENCGYLSPPLNNSRSSDNLQGNEPYSEWKKCHRMKIKLKGPESKMGVKNRKPPECTHNEHTIHA